jgi:hypothetical protein
MHSLEALRAGAVAERVRKHRSASNALFGSPARLNEPWGVVSVAFMRTSQFEVETRVTELSSTRKFPWTYLRVA